MEEQEDIQPKTLSGLRAQLQEKFVDIAKAAKDKSEHGDDDGGGDDEKKPFFKKGGDEEDHDGDEGEKKKKKPPFFKKKDGEEHGDESKKDSREIDIHIRGEGGKKKECKEEMENEMDEETIAASSLHPGAKSVKDSKAITPSRVESLKNVVTFAAGLNKQDLSKWFKQSQDCYGPGKHFGVPKDGASNQATIDTTLGKGSKHRDPMPKLKEDLDELFAGSDLTEEFREKTAILFEAAVHARLVLESARLEEEFVEILTEEITHFTSTMTDKVDSYLDYVVENWMAENQIALETSLRNELTSEFIDGLKTLFTEHYIDVPEEKVDNLENRLEEKVTECNELKGAVIGAAKQEVFAEMASNLTLSQQEKFATLAEGIEFEGDFDNYATKLMVVKEQYFQNKAPAHSNILEEQYEGDDAQMINHFVDPSVNRYAAAIARTVKTAGVVGS